MSRTRINITKATMGSKPVGRNNVLPWYYDDDQGQWYSAFFKIDLGMQDVEVVEKVVGEGDTQKVYLNITQWYNKPAGSFKATPASRPGSYQPPQKGEAYEGPDEVEAEEVPKDSPGREQRAVASISMCAVGVVSRLWAARGTSSIDISDEAVKEEFLEDVRAVVDVIVRAAI